MPNSATGPDARSLHVLVVDDEKRLRALLVEMIPELGFHVSSAATGEEALAAMHRQPHEIVLLDLHLPQMSGLELLEEIHRRWPATQVVVLTAFGDLETARRAIHLDVSDFLCKPFHLRDIELAFDRARKRALTTQSPAENSLPRQDGVNEPAMTLAESEYRMILSALHRHSGNRTAAAAELGISRRTLHYRVAEYRARRWQID